MRKSDVVSVAVGSRDRCRAKEFFDWPSPCDNIPRVCTKCIGWELYPALKVDFQGAKGLRLTNK